jgi:hypothetical protein
MKQSYLITYSICFCIMAFSFSCSKESTVAISAPPCTTCSIAEPKTVDVHIIANNWERQSSSSYSCNLTILMAQSGIIEDQIYSISIVNGASVQRIYSNGSIVYLGGTLQLSVQNHVYQLIYGKQLPTYYGETPSSFPLPFSSIDVKFSLLDNAHENPAH